VARGEDRVQKHDTPDLDPGKQESKARADATGKLLAALARKRMLSFLTYCEVVEILSSEITSAGQDARKKIRTPNRRQSHAASTF
jgi:hypothetical protein